MTDTISYVRVSTVEQAAEDKTSLADQTAAVAALAQRMGRQVGRTFEDRGVSGGTAERPGFQAMIAFAEASPRPRQSPGYVLVLNASRFGRFDPDEHGYWRMRLRKAGWLVRFAEADEIEDPTGRSIMRTLSAAQAQEYRLALSRNSRRGKRGSAEQGFWSGPAPFGYRREVIVPPDRRRVLESGVPKAKDERVRLTLGPDREVRLVRLAFEAYASGRYSVCDVTKYLQRFAPHLRWCRTHVAHFLRNPAYVGDVLGGRRRFDLDGGAFRRIQDPAEWYGKQDAHEGIISRELFERVARQLRTNARTMRRSDMPYLLTGLVRCVYCGEPYTGGGVSHGSDGNQRWHFYRCRGGVASPSICPGKIGTIMRHILEPAVIRVVAEEVGRPEVRALIAEVLDEQLAKADQGGADQIRTLMASRQDLDRRRANLVEAVADGTVTKAEAGPNLKRLRDDLAAVDQQVERLRFAGRNRHQAHEERAKLLALLSDFPARLQSLPGPARRALLLPWLEGGTFDKKSRSLSLTIRRIPDMPSVFAVAVHAGADHSIVKALTVIRTISLKQDMRALAQMGRAAQRLKNGGARG